VLNEVIMISRFPILDLHPVEVARTVPGQILRVTGQNLSDSYVLRVDGTGITPDESLFVGLENDVAGIIILQHQVYRTVLDVSSLVELSIEDPNVQPLMPNALANPGFLYAMRLESGDYAVAMAISHQPYQDGGGYLRQGKARGYIILSSPTSYEIVDGQPACIIGKIAVSPIPKRPTAVDG
jgi:hypothetical protein